MKTMASHYETSAGVGRAAGGGRNCYLTKKLKIKLYGTPVNLKARKFGIIPIFAHPQGEGQDFPRGGLKSWSSRTSPPPLNQFNGGQYPPWDAQQGAKLQGGQRLPTPEIPSGGNVTPALPCARPGCGQDNAMVSPGTETRGKISQKNLAWT